MHAELNTARDTVEFVILRIRAEPSAAGDLSFKFEI
jgi:hypothetical protein